MTTLQHSQMLGWCVFDLGGVYLFRPSFYKLFFLAGKLATHGGEDIFFNHVNYHTQNIFARIMNLCYTRVLLVFPKLAATFKGTVTV